MNQTLPQTQKTKGNTLLRSNPILNRLSKMTERSETNAASYYGIAVKTTYFLLITLVGMIAQLLVKNMMASEPVWQTIEVYKQFTVSLTQKEAVIVGVVLLVGLVSELAGIFVRRTVPVTGTLYAASQGYVISFLVFKVLNGYEYLGLEALLLTIAVVAVMSYLYSSGIIKADKKFRTVLLALMLGSIGLGVLSFLGSLIPATRPYVQAMMQNAGFTIAVDVIGLVIAALFLISDFSVIDECVREHYPKEYEWSAAFGLVFTVIWIYLKILDLLMQLTDNKKSA
ncbi:MAG: Bax inhibitor-1/YccA family protein [Clostridia bacterium]|nr:Bax inhibitor-1/YccA family protein [Clostridia bacterium]